MGRQPVSVAGREEVAEFRNELLGRLGLQATASDQDIEAAHTELIEYLEAAPREMKSWAVTRTTEVDEAFALLTGPEEDLIRPAAPIVATLQDGPDETTRIRPASPAEVAAPIAPAPAPAAPGLFAAGKRRTRMLQVVLPVLLVAVVFGVSQIGKGDAVPGISGETTNNASATPDPNAAVPVDQAKVTALTAKVTKNPKDIASMQGIGDIYFASRDYKNAIVWEKKVLAVDPKNEVALLSVGAASFNDKNPAEAKKHWLVAAKLYPKNAEVHYDLGFLYMSQTPPDKANMQAEWAKVVAIDPNSNLAKTVSTHLKSTTSTPAPSASAK
jgi:tetratricopeptide (TPR) repeat protein